MERELDASDRKLNKKTGKPYGDWQKEFENLQKNKDLAQIFREYQKQLEKNGLYDYEDMILFVLNRPIV